MLRQIFPESSELCMILSTIGILLILFIPIPSSLLDLLLIINFSWALTILLLTFYTDKPLSFSTFPALLLLSTLLRLALNISATRLILTDGHAGQVIQAMGEYVIQGNYVMGFVVFAILIIIQYLVVSSGAQRVAEVAARFTLDSMPGKQMSIDADLNMGIISQKTAQFRRSQVEKEANFYGAMDGASKFVKGDAIAGILIIVVNVIGGFAVGMAQKGLSFNQSLQHYTLLTIGDGLVTQIPALIISTATGIIVTRAASDAQLGSEISKQISAYPKSLVMVCCGLLSLMFLKGIPLVSVLIVFSLFAIIAWSALHKKTAPLVEEVEESLYEKIKVYPLEIHLNSTIFRELSQQENFLKQIEQLREYFAYELGFILPELKLFCDKTLNYPFYYVSVQGNRLGIHPLHLDKLLAISTNSNIKNLNHGIEVRDPSYGLPSLWIDHNFEQKAKELDFTLCEPLNVLVTHLKEIITNHCAQLLTREETENLLSQQPLRDELIPNHVSLSQTQRILQNLLEEKVSIRYLRLILEVLLEHGKTINDPTALTELVRARLGTTICQKLMQNQNQNSLSVLTLAPTLEQKLNQQLGNDQWALEPSLMEIFMNSLAHQVAKMLGEKKRPILVCSSTLRKPIKRLTQRIIPQLTVLAMNEVPLIIQIESFGIVQEGATP